jgi:hypothetical protein
VAEERKQSKNHNHGTRRGQEQNGTTAARIAEIGNHPQYDASKRKKLLEKKMCLSRRSTAKVEFASIDRNNKFFERQDNVGHSLGWAHTGGCRLLVGFFERNPKRVLASCQIDRMADPFVNDPTGRLNLLSQ